MRTSALSLLAAAVLSACAPAERVEVPVTRVVTQAFEVTREVEVTRVVLVTPNPTAIPAVPTSTPRPTHTPGPSPTVPPTWTPEPTRDRSQDARGDGSYLVPDEMAPGIWRSSEPSDPGESCWIKIESLGGDMLDISGELAGDTIRVPSRPAIVLIGGGSGNRCTWSFLQP